MCYYDGFPPNFVIRIEDYLYTTSSKPIQKGDLLIYADEELLEQQGQEDGEAFIIGISAGEYDEDNIVIFSAGTPIKAPIYRCKKLTFTVPSIGRDDRYTN